MKSKFKLTMLAAAMFTTSVGPALALPGYSCVNVYPTNCATFKLVNTTIVKLPARSKPNWGTTPAQIQSLFSYNIYYNFINNPNINAAVTGMDPYMLARMSTELATHDASGYTYSIMAYAGERLSAVNIRRMGAAFGVYWQNVMLQYASPTVRAQFWALPNLAAYPTSTYWLTIPGNKYTDNSNLYLYDLFLNSYTAGAGDSMTNHLQIITQYQRLTVSNKGLPEVAAVVGIVVGIIAGVQGLVALYEDASGKPNALQQAGDFVINGWNIFQNDNSAISFTGGVPALPVVIPSPTISSFPPIEGDDPGDGGNYKICLGANSPC